MEHILRWIWLSRALSNRKIKKILSIYGDADTVYRLGCYPEAEHFTEDDITALSDKNLDEAKRIYESCINGGIKIIVWDGKDYPPCLKTIYDPPVVLYAKGIIPDWDSIFTLGIVGTRKMSEYGKAVTTQFVSDLLDCGVTPVTGFAIGNDVIANRIATERGLFSIALMGGGVDYIYPAAHWQLYNRMLKCGLFLSEHPPGTKPASWNFPARNRILSGICRGVLVTEAPKKSGALITAHLAADQNRDVFVIPAPINLVSCEGSNILIQEGAKAVISAKDILCEYPELNHIEQKEEESSSDIRYEDESEDDIILRLLLNQDMTADEICIHSGMSMTECNSKCFMLELAGKIQKLPGNIYRRKPFSGI